MDRIGLDYDSINISIHRYFIMVDFFSLIFIHKTMFTFYKWLDFSVNLPVTNQVIHTSSGFLPLSCHPACVKAACVKGAE